MQDRIFKKYNALKNIHFERLSLQDLIDDEVDYLLEKNKGLSHFVCKEKLINDVELIIVSYGLFEIVRNRRKHRDSNKSIREKIDKVPMQLFNILKQVDTHKEFSQMFLIRYRLEDDVEFLYGNKYGFNEIKTKKIVEAKPYNHKTKHLLTYEELFTMVNMAYKNTDDYGSFLEIHDFDYTSIQFSSSVKRKITNKRYINNREADFLKSVRLFALESKWHYASIVNMLDRQNQNITDEFVELLINIGNSILFHSFEPCFEKLYDILEKHEEPDYSIIEKIENYLMKPLLLYALSFVKGFNFDAGVEIVGASIDNVIHEIKNIDFQFVEKEIDPKVLGKYFGMLLHYHQRCNVTPIGKTQNIQVKSLRYLLEECLTIKNMSYPYDTKIDLSKWIINLIYLQLLTSDSTAFITSGELIRILEKYYENIGLLFNDVNSDWENVDNKSNPYGESKFIYFVKNTMNELYVRHDVNGLINLPKPYGLFYLALFCLRTHPVARHMKYDHQGYAIWTKKTNFKIYAEYIRLVNSVLILLADDETARYELLRISEKVYSGNLIIEIAKAVKKASTSFVKLSKMDKRKISRKLLNLRQLDDIEQRVQYCRLTGKESIKLVDEETTVVDYEINGLLTLIKDCVNKTISTQLVEYNVDELESLRVEVLAKLVDHKLNTDFHGNLWNKFEVEVGIVMSSFYN